MGINKKNEKEKYILEDLEDQLEKLLNTLKPSENLKVGDIIEVKKNIILPIYGEIKKGKSISILEINEGEKLTTTGIKFQILGEGEKEYEMSKWIFIGYFCDEIKSEEEQIGKKIHELKKNIKKEKDKINIENIDKYSQEVKHQVHFLLKLIKVVGKHLKRNIK